MHTGPAGQTLTYYEADVEVPLPAYGGRYHWVVSGTSSVMERDHRFLTIKDEGAYVLMQPKARDYDTSGLSNTAPIARDAQQSLVTDVPQGQYAATAATDASSYALMEAFEKGAIVCFDGHGYDDLRWVRDEGYPRPPEPDLGWVRMADRVVYSMPPPDPPPEGEGPNVVALVNAQQCHLAVFYTCWAGDDFQATLPAEGVDCVVGVQNALLYNGIVSITWFEAFWEDLRQGATVATALDDAKAAVQALLLQPPPGASEWWNTDLITATALNHTIVEPEKSGFYK